MTATRMRALTLAALAGVWAASAYFLWASSKVPDLHLPHLDPHRLFSGHTLARTGSYERFERWSFVLSQLAVLSAFVWYALRGERFTRESAAGRIGTGMLLGMLGFAIVWLVQVPFRLADLWWARRHGLEKQGYLQFLLSDWIQLGSQFLLLCLALLIVMGLAGRLGSRWWLLGGPSFAGLVALFLFVSPYLTPGLKRPRDARLAAHAHAIAAREGVGDVPLRVEKVSKRTRAINAYAFGLGPSRRVVLWDTLLDGRYARREVLFVLGHEYGHQARNHLLKGVAWFALFALPEAFLIERLTRRKGGMRNPAAVPLALLVLVVMQLLALPLRNAISRHIEAEADWMGLQTTRDPAAATLLFEHFTSDDLSQPDPPTWSYLLLDDHPTTMQRVAMACAWARTTTRARSVRGLPAGCGSPRSSATSRANPASRPRAPS
jgi:STE24 endopeptidase